MDDQHIDGRDHGKYPLQFEGVRHLQSWLNQHPDGKRILGHAVMEKLDGREPVLIMLHADGWVEVFGYKSIAPVIIQRPYSLADSLDIDAWCMRQMPLPHRKLYFRNRQRTEEMTRRITFPTIEDFRWQKWLIDELGKIEV